MIALASHRDLTREAVEAVAWDGEALALDPAALERVAAGQAELAAVLAGGARVYGVSTGMGWLASADLGPVAQEAHQRSLFLGRAVGGPPWPEAAETRALLVTRLGNLLSGHAGVGPELCRFLVDRVNDGFVPAVPRRGAGSAGGGRGPGRSGRPPPPPRRQGGDRPARRVAAGQRPGPGPAAVGRAAGRPAAGLGGGRRRRPPGAPGPRHRRAPRAGGRHRLPGGGRRAGAGHGRVPRGRAGHGPQAGRRRAARGPPPGRPGLGRPGRHLPGPGGRGQLRPRGGRAAPPGPRADPGDGGLRAAGRPPGVVAARPGWGRRGRPGRSSREAARSASTSPAPGLRALAACLEELVAPVDRDRQLGPDLARLVEAPERDELALP